MFFIGIQHIVDNLVVVLDVSGYWVECALIVERCVRVVSCGVQFIGD